jgi:hypothetical protein
MNEELNFSSYPASVRAMTEEKVEEAGVFMH